MANEQIKQNFKNIANAIRSKTGENGTMTAEEMPSKIESIETGITPSGSLDITENGDGIDVTQYAAVNVAIPEPAGTYNIEKNGNYDISGYAEVDVWVPTSASSPSLFDTNEISDAYDLNIDNKLVVTNDGDAYYIRLNNDGELLVGPKEMIDLTLIDESNIHSTGSITDSMIKNPFKVVNTSYGKRIELNLAVANFDYLNKTFYIGGWDSSHSGYGSGYAVSINFRDSEGLDEYSVQETCQQLWPCGIVVKDMKGQELTTFHWDDSAIYWNIARSS